MRMLIAIAVIACAASASAQTETPKPAATAKNPASAATVDAAHKPKPATKPGGGIPVFKENGKTCSGQDSYKVCW